MGGNNYNNPGETQALNLGMNLVGKNQNQNNLYPNIGQNQPNNWWNPQGPAPQNNAYDPEKMNNGWGPNPPGTNYGNTNNRGW